ncbi:Uncharacterized protein APZ42_003891, partial [Daphnia magna]
MGFYGKKIDDKFQPGQEKSNYLPSRMAYYAGCTRLTLKRGDNLCKKPVVVPASIRQALVEEYHDSPLSGHLAYRRTCQRLRDKYYWPSMLEDVKEYCQKCETCARQPRS